MHIYPDTRPTIHTAGICWSGVCSGDCGSTHPDTSVPERPVSWSWLPATHTPPRYMGERVWVMGQGSDAHDTDHSDDMSNES